MSRPPIDADVKKRRRRLGARLRIEREAAQLSQGRLAELLEVQKIHVQRYESGDKVIPLDLLPRLCESLGVTAAQLLGDDRGLLTRAA